MTDQIIPVEIVEMAAKAAFCEGLMSEYCEHIWNSAGTETIETYYRETRAALESAAPLIAARAWEQGYRAANREWEHIYDGHTVEPGDESGTCTTCSQGNPYQIEAGR